jgi:hypothetical protein
MFSKFVKLDALERYIRAVPMSCRLMSRIYDFPNPNPIYNSTALPAENRLSYVGN